MSYSNYIATSDEKAGLFSDSEGGNVWVVSPKGHRSEFDSVSDTKVRIWSMGTDSKTIHALQWDRDKDYDLNSLGSEDKYMGYAEAAPDDLDDAKVGAYFCTGQETHSPITTASNGLLLVFSFATAVMQIHFDLQGSGSIHYRYSTDSGKTFNSWKQDH